MNDSQRIFFSTCLICFIGPFMSSSINVAIPTMATEFGVLVDQLSWVLTAFLVGTAAILLPTGRWADLWGRRRTYMTGELIFLAATLGGGLSNSPFMLIFFRALQGTAMAAVYTAYMPMLLASQDRSRQGHVLGVTVSNTYLGLSVGPFIGGMITQYLTWRFVFFFSAIIIAASYLLIRPVTKEWFGNRSIPFNGIGALLSIAGITSLLIGLSTYTSAGQSHKLLYIGILLLGIFIYHEKHTHAAILPLYIFRNLTFSMSNVTSLIHYSATYAVSFLLSLHLQLILHLSASLTGAILLSQPIMMALLSTPAGTLSDKIGSRYVATSGIALTAICLTIFAVSNGTSITQTIVLLIVLGIGAALFGAPNNSAIMGSVADEHKGTASSMLALVRNFGQAASMSLVTLIFSTAVISAENYEASIQTGIHTTFILLAMLCTIAIFTSWIRGKS